MNQTSSLSSSSKMPPPIVGGGESSQSPSSSSSSSSSKNFDSIHFDDAGGGGGGDNSQAKPWISYSTRVNWYLDLFVQHMEDDGNEPGTVNFLRVHFLVALGISIIAFLIWSILACVSRQSIPWFTFAISFFIISITLHFYVFVKTPVDWLPVHIVAFTVVHMNIFIWYIFDIFGAGWENVWPIHVSFPTTLFMWCHYCHVKHGKQPLLFLVGAYTILNVYLFMRFLIFHELPTFIYTFFGLLIPLTMLGVMVWHPEDRLLLHKAFYLSVSLCLFVIWGVRNAHRVEGDEDDVHWPWFSLFIVLGAAALVAHIYFLRRKSALKTYSINPSS